MGSHSDSLLLFPDVEDGEQAGALLNIQVHRTEVIYDEQIIGSHLVDEFKLPFLSLRQLCLRKEDLCGTEIDCEILS